MIPLKCDPLVLKLAEIACSPLSSEDIFAAKFESNFALTQIFDNRSRSLPVVEILS